MDTCGFQFRFGMLGSFAARDNDRKKKKPIKRGEEERWRRRREPFVVCAQLSVSAARL